MKKNIFIHPTANLKEALKKLNETAEKTLIVVDENKRLLGTLTDGDVRRYIIRTGSLKGKVKDFYNKNPIFIREEEIKSKEELKRKFLENKIEVIPIVNREHVISDYITWTEVFSEKEIKRPPKELNNIPVVIMAGGKGTRLQPFTHILPKPLIPIENKPVIEHIIENFKNYGVKKFFLTVNYKGEMIKAYFDGIEKDYEIEYIWEPDFLGTVGSLKLLEGKLKGDFIVSNSDILIKANLYSAFKFHKDNNSVFTSITAIKHYKIPYGIVNIRNGGTIENIEEKPEYIFQINTGVYIINDKALKYIPNNKCFHMPELMNKLIENKEKVLAYPISESDYIDIGQWEEYKEALKKLSELEQI